MEKETLIQDLSFSFSLRMIRLFKDTEGKRKDLTLFRQLLRSGTSVGANIVEAQGAQSLKDFIQKISVAQKEGKESEYWIKLLSESDMIDKSVANELLTEIGSIIKILSKILITSKNKLQSNE